MIAVLLALKRSEVFVRFDWEIREWISKTSPNAPIFVNSSAMKPVTRAVVKKTMICAERSESSETNELSGLVQ